LPHGYTSYKVFPSQDRSHKRVMFNYIPDKPKNQNFTNTSQKLPYLETSLYYILYTSGEKLPPYLRLSEKAIANSITLKVSK